MNPRPSVAFSPYVVYSRDDWAALRADTPMPLSEAELENLSGLTERVSTQEVVEIYLPLSRLLNLHVEALQELHGAATRFLRKGDAKMPFIIGLAGSVAVGKSTTAACSRRCSPAGRATRASSSCRPTDFSFPMPCSKSAG